MRSAMPAICGVVSVGGGGGATSFATTVTSALVASAPSLAVKRSTYVPAAENDAVVTAADALPNVTVPGPDTLLHASFSEPGGFGNPSSVALPDRFACAGSVTVWFAPALTRGA